MLKNMSHRMQSNLWAIVIILVMIFFYVESYDISREAAYPRIVIVAVAILCAIILIQSYFEAKEEEKMKQIQRSKGELSTAELAELRAKEVEEKAPVKDLVVLIATSVITLFLWESLSFMLAAAICMMVLYIYKKQPVVKSVIITLCTILFIQIVFRNFFTIPLPSPAWWPYF